MFGYQRECRADPAVTDFIVLTSMGLKFALSIFSFLMVFSGVLSCLCSSSMPSFSSLTASIAEGKKPADRE